MLRSKRCILIQQTFVVPTFVIYRFIKKEVVMPNMDGTGPTGKGPKSGRGLGKCNPKETPEENRPNENLNPERRGRGLGKRTRRRGE